MESGHTNPAKNCCPLPNVGRLKTLQNSRVFPWYHHLGCSKNPTGERFFCDETPRSSRFKSTRNQPAAPLPRACGHGPPDITRFLSGNHMEIGNLLDIYELYPIMSFNDFFEKSLCLGEKKRCPSHWTPLWNGVLIHQQPSAIIL